MNHKTYLSLVFQQPGAKNVIIADERRSGKTFNTAHWIKEEAAKGRRIAVITPGLHSLNFIRRIVGETYGSVSFFAERFKVKDNEFFDTIVVDEQVNLNYFLEKNPNLRRENAIYVMHNNNLDYHMKLEERLPFFHLYPNLKREIKKSRL